MPQRNVASNFTFEQQRVEINNLAQDFWSQKGTVDTALPTFLKHDGSNDFTGQTLAVPNAFTINSNSGNGTVTISGNLDVTGTTTTVSSANLEVTDKNILIAKGSTSDAQADGAGITIDSATDITFNFIDAKDALVSSIGLEGTTFLKAPYGQFTGSGTPSAGQGVEINAPDTNTGQIISYDRGGSAYKELRVKGSSVGIYGGTTNALVGTFNSTGLDVTGSLAVNSGTVNTCATFTSTDAGAVINITDNSARSSIEQHGTDLKIISDTDAGNANSTIKFQVDASTKMTLDSSGNLDVSGNVTTTGSITISSAAPNLLFTESDDDPDWGILCSAGQMKFQDVTATANILTLDADKIQAVKNLDALAGIDVTGTLTATGQITGNSSNSGKYVRMYGSAGTGRWDIYGHGANLRFSDNDSAGDIVFDRNVDANGGLDVSGVLDVDSGSNSDNHSIAKFEGTTGGNLAGLRIQYYTCGSDDNRTGLYWQHENVGNIRMWMDDAGFLRQKSSNPTSNTDGEPYIRLGTTNTGNLTITGGIVQNDDSAETSFGTKSLPAADSGLYIRNGNGGTGTYSSIGLIASSTGAASDQSASLVVKCTASGLSPEVYLTQRDGNNSQRNTLAFNTLGDATFIGSITSSSGSISDSKGNLRRLPQNNQSGGYNLVAADAGTHINTTGDIGLYTGQFAVGDAIVIFNKGTADISIGLGGGVTMYQAGTTDVGNRTLAAKGICTILCTEQGSGTNTFVISGAGLS